MNEPGSNSAPISQEDLALYAMRSLPADEMAAVAAALRDNPQAQQELARIHDDLALLALSVDQQAVPAVPHGPLVELGAVEADHPPRARLARGPPQLRSRNLVQPWPGMQSPARGARACRIPPTGVPSARSTLPGLTPPP